MELLERKTTNQQHCGAKVKSLEYNLFFHVFLTHNGVLKRSFAKRILGFDYSVSVGSTYFEATQTTAYCSYWKREGTYCIVLNAWKRRGGPQYW
jgi:hypothetical protein